MKTTAAKAAMIRAGYVLVAERIGAPAPDYFQTGSADGLWCLVLDQTAKADVTHVVGWKIAPDQATRFLVMTGFAFDQGVTLEMIDESKYL